jgi:uncharacterized protein YdbL (DUF1318 family)
MMKQVMVLLALSVTIAFPVSAGGDLANAFKSKKVCERMDGYIAATSGNEGEVANLVQSVNAKRAHVYAEIAAKEALPPETVAAEHAREENARAPEKFCR